jgi:hypothetical protein
MAKPGFQIPAGQNVDLSKSDLKSGGEVIHLSNSVERFEAFKVYRVFTLYSTILHS